MKKYFRTGSIVVVGKYHEDVIYDVFSRDRFIQFDGRGGVTECAATLEIGAPNLTCAMTVYINRKKIDPFCEKSVRLLGRTQKIFLKDGDVKITVYQFVCASERAIFYEITANKAGDYDFCFDFDNTKTARFAYAAGAGNRYIPEADMLCLNTKKNVRLVLSYDGDKEYCKKLLSRFADYKKQVDDEIRQARIPPSAKTQKEKAFYLSHYFSALERYAEVGEFKGFLITNDRTYFRDSYWTVLPMYKRRPDVVRNQILTLAHGIRGNGDCPSAVTVELNPFVHHQYDTPCFFVLMVYDYINHTGDFSVLDESVNGRTVYQHCLQAVDKLSQNEDKTSLIVKGGAFNTRDWASEINRTGYVTYVELLYARALECLSRIAGKRDKVRAERYRGMYLRTKNAINTLLWDDEKGYYINYRDGDFIEDNLSVDTILAVLFGIADEEKTNRLLDNVGAILETRNNKMQKAGDFGVMCVYPFYREPGRSFHRNLQDYRFHNGAAWPYWSALVAYAQMMNGRDYTYALTSSFDWNVKRGNYTPIEYYSPICPSGAPLHGAAADAAWVCDWRDGDFFLPNEAVWETK